MYPLPTQLKMLVGDVSLQGSGGRACGPLCYSAASCKSFVSEGKQKGLLGWGTEHRNITTTLQDARFSLVSQMRKPVAFGIGLEYISYCINKQISTYLSRRTFFHNKQNCYPAVVDYVATTFIFLYWSYHFLL